MAVGPVQWSRPDGLSGKGRVRRCAASAGAIRCRERSGQNFPVRIFARRSGPSCARGHSSPGPGATRRGRRSARRWCTRSGGGDAPHGSRSSGRGYPSCPAEHGDLTPRARPRLAGQVVPHFDSSYCRRPWPRRPGCWPHSRRGRALLRLAPTQLLVLVPHGPRKAARRPWTAASRARAGGDPAASCRMRSPVATPALPRGSAAGRPSPPRGHRGAPPPPAHLTRRGSFPIIGRHGRAAGGALATAWAGGVYVAARRGRAAAPRLWHNINHGP
jgi:hypothetical protein